MSSKLAVSLTEMISSLKFPISFRAVRDVVVAELEGRPIALIFVDEESISLIPYPDGEEMVFINTEDAYSGIVAALIRALANAKLQKLKEEGILMPRGKSRVRGRRKKEEKKRKAETVEETPVREKSLGEISIEELRRRRLGESEES